MNEEELSKVRIIEFEEYKSISANINDPVLLILRVHLYSEYLLERIIHATLKRGDRVLENGRLQYLQKLELAHSFDVIDDRCVAALRQLNKIRNRFAHELKMVITFSDIDRIGMPLGPHYLVIKKDNVSDLLNYLKTLLAYICGGLVVYAHSSEGVKSDDE